MTDYTYTIETRISKRENKEIYEYFEKYFEEYNKILRYAWKIMINDEKKSINKLNQEIQRKYGILKRTANSITRTLKGRMESLKELKNYELQQYNIKILSLENDIEKLKNTLDIQKKKAEENKMTVRELEKYRNLKRKIYYKRQKLNKVKMRKENLEKNINEKIYKLGFGGKNFFKKQYNLEKNGYKTHEKWYNEYKRKRDSSISYIGSKDEKACNQMFQLEKNEEKYNIKVRKDGKQLKENIEEKYVFGKCEFKYKDNEIEEELKEKRHALTYRIVRRKKGLYLQVILTKKIEADKLRTSRESGCIGLDYNVGFIAVSETDKKGNLVKQKKYKLRYHGTGNKAKNEIREKIKRILEDALEKGKSIVIEDLNFKKVKAGMFKGKNKKYNKMLHQFDYGRYKETIENSGKREYVEIIKVNPYNTSKIAKEKYCKRKINIHQGAAYVIARKGQGYKDSIKKTA